MTPSKPVFRVRQFDMPPLSGTESVHRIEFSYVCHGPHPWLGEVWQGPITLSVHVDNADPDSLVHCAAQLAERAKEHIAEDERNQVPA